MKKAGLRFILFLVIFASGSFFVKASEPDTLVNISSVTVYALRTQYYKEDKRVISLDSSLVLPSGDETLGELLQRMLPVNLMQYGSAGSLTTLSFRGSHTNQTQINWNGFPINSLTSGIADLSQIYSGMFEQIMLIPGASGSLYGSGSAGGAINLDNKPVWGRGMFISSGLDGGSFGTYGGHILLQAGNDKIQSRSSFFYQDALNNFSYKDDFKYGSPTGIARHNRAQYAGFIHTLSARFRNNIYLQSGFWIQKKRKEIPSIMGSYSANNQEQRDSSMRVYMVIEKRWRQSSFSARGAWFSDNMRFTDKVSPDVSGYTIDSRFHTSHFMTDIYFRHASGKHWKLDAGIASSAATAKVTAYDKNIHDYSLDLYGGMKYRKEYFLASLTMRQNFNPYRNPLPQVDAGIRYILQPDRLSFHFNYATKFRLPTLNDKYWTPGGNLSLQPEHGWGITGGLDLHSGKRNLAAKPWSFRWQLDGFSNLLYDQIQWMPGTGYWHPENVEKIWSYGLENSLHGSWRKDKFSASLVMNYSYTVSNVLENQSLPQGHYRSRYVPPHTASAILRIDYGIIYTGFYENFTGARFTTADNNPVYKMNSFALTDIIFGAKTRTRLLIYDLRFVIKNITDANYQVIRSYPMPGRAYYLKARITFQTNKH